MAFLLNLKNGLFGVYFIQSPTLRPTLSLVDVLPMGMVLFAEILKVPLNTTRRHSWTTTDNETGGSDRPPLTQTNKSRIGMRLVN